MITTPQLLLVLHLALQEFHGVSGKNVAVHDSHQVLFGAGVAGACISTVNQERWNCYQQTGEEYVPLIPPMVST